MTQGQRAPLDFSGSRRGINAHERQPLLAVQIPLSNRNARSDFRKTAGEAVSGGPALAEKLAAHTGKPLLVVDIGAADVGAHVRAWLARLRRRMEVKRHSG